MFFFFFFLYIYISLYFQVENNPYDPSLMVFMDYRDYMKQKVPCLEAEYPTFLYAMPMSSTRVFFEVISNGFVLLTRSFIHNNYVQSI